MYDNKEISREEIALSRLNINLEEEKRVINLKDQANKEDIRQSDSLKVTEKEMKSIADVLADDSLELDAFDRSELEIRQGRNMSHILINSRKFTGDSKEMKAIKDNLLTLENALATKRENPLEPMTTGDIMALENMYLSTIQSCQYYLGVKTTHTGSARYNMVFNRMNQLMDELSLVGKMRELSRIPGMAYCLQVGSYSELIMAAKIHNYLLDIGVDDGVDKTLVNNQVDGAELTLVKLPDEVMNSLDKPAQDIIDILTAMKKPHDFVKKAGDDYAHITNCLMNILSNFPQGAYATYINSGTIGYEGKGLFRKYKDNDGKVRKATTVIGLRQSENGDLFIKVGEFEQQLPYTREVLVNSMTNSIIDNIDKFGREAVDKQMEWIEYSAFSKYDLTEVRNKCLKYIAGRTGIEATRFHNLDAANVRLIALSLKHDNVSKDEIISILGDIDSKDTARMVNGKETLELLTHRTNRLEKLQDKVEMVHQNAGPVNAAGAEDDDPQLIDGWTPEEYAVKAFIADLVFSKDTWMADGVANDPVARIKNVIREHSYAFALITRDDTVLDSMITKLPGNELSFGMIKDQLAKMRKRANRVGYDNPFTPGENITAEAADAFAEETISRQENDEAFRELDEGISEYTKNAAHGYSLAMNFHNNNLFGNDEEAPDTKLNELAATKVKTLDASGKEKFIKDGNELLDRLITDSMQGDSGQGLFMKNVLNDYFDRVDDIDRRAMIASALRDSKAMTGKQTAAQLKAASGAFIGGMFKGAGPLMQKMLQGMPIDGIPVELRPAFKDVKSNLLPIPKEIVESQFLAMVERSKGAVTKIEVTRALGAASVGQAFLCKLYGPNIPEEGKEVVVKLLRPDVRNRMMREKKAMLQCAEDTNPGMVATYLGQLERIEEELDLTIEARNVDRGKIYDKSRKKGQRTDGVTSMKLNELIAPTPNSMVIEKSPGTTVDKYLGDLDQGIIQTLDKILSKDMLGRPVRIGGKMQLDIADYNGIYVPEARAKLTALLAQAQKRQQYLVTLAEKWVEEGLFGSGFYHGDLHAGNIMIDDDCATVIDFGNATQIKPEHMACVTKMMAAATIGDAETFMGEFAKLMKKPEDKKAKKATDAAVDRVTGKLKKIFKLGSASSSGQRIAVALMKAQEEGLELPSAIFNFSQCQIRLQNTINDFNNRIVQMQDLLKQFEPLDREGASANIVAHMQRAATVNDNTLPEVYKFLRYNLTECFDMESFVHDLRKTDEKSRREFDEHFMVEDDLYKNTDFAKALENLRKAQDSKEKLSDEEMKGLEEKVFKEHTKAQRKVNVSKVGNAYFNYTVAVNSSVEAVFNITKYSNELFASEMDKYLVKEGEKDEFTLVYEEVVDMRERLRTEENVDKNEVKRLKERFAYQYKKKIKDDVERIKKEFGEEYPEMTEYSQSSPKDFIAVMGNVIGENLVNTMSRLGFWGWWNASALNEMASSTVK